MNSLVSFYNHQKSLFDIWINTELHIPLPPALIFALTTVTDNQRDLFYTQHQFNGLKKRFKAIEICISNDPTNTDYLEERKLTLSQLADLDTKRKIQLEKVNHDEKIIQEQMNANMLEVHEKYEQQQKKYQAEFDFEEKIQQEIALFRQKN
jgi:hypothetical protein